MQHPRCSHKIIRLRCTALLRSKRHAEALVDADAAVAMLPGEGVDPSLEVIAEEQVARKDCVPVALQTQIWLLRGIACARCQCFEEGATSFARALRLRAIAWRNTKEHTPAAVDMQALLEYFLEAAASASTSSLPFELYATGLESADGGKARDAQTVVRTKPGAGATCTPAFRLQLRPRFSPWPLQIMAPVSLSSSTTTGSGPSTRVSFYCVTSAMPAEPHLCLIHHAAKHEALVLVLVRIDGMVELVSNSSVAAWEGVHEILLGQPAQHGLDDFDVVASGWQRDGRSVRAFEVIVAQQWQEWQDGRTRAAQQRHLEERRKEEAKAELLGWLEGLGLADCGALLIRENIDVDTLQYL